MVAEGARERRSKLYCSEQASKAGQISGQVRRGEMNVPRTSRETFKPKRDSRAEIAREAKIPERKRRAAGRLSNRAPRVARVSHLAANRASRQSSRSCR
jgi:hypothetical protein